MNKYSVEIPWWAANEEREEWILFLAFLYKLGQAYGFKNTYNLYDTDIRMLLQIAAWKMPEDVIDQSPYKEWIFARTLKTKTTGIRLMIPRWEGKTMSCKKHLTEDKYILMWVYVMGAFNNNLVEDQYHKDRMGLSREWKNIFSSDGELL